jgi:FkbM family methyltransferase
MVTTDKMPKKTKLAPIRVPDAELRRWSAKSPLGFSFAKIWSRHMPRGKGWVPRKLGRLVGQDWRITIPTSMGAQLAVDPQNLDVYTTITRKDGVWEQNVLTACRAITKAGDVFFDIGANAGWVSVEMSKAFGGSLTLCAFEPQPTLARMVATSFQLNGFGKSSVYRLMLGNEEGEAELFIPAHSIHASAISREAGADKIAVPMMTLDRLIADGELPSPNVIKIDVEGGELDVFKGAAETIRKQPPLIIFESDYNTDRFGYDRAALCAYLGELAAYQFFYVDELGQFLSADDLGNPDFDNLLALPPGVELPRV